MPDRDPEARRIARYVDRLMAAGSAAQDAVSDALTDPASRAAARRLRAELVRVHPSFTFEEELSARLRAAASAMHEQRGATEGYSGTVIRIAIPAPDGALRGGSSGASNGASTDLAVPDLATSPDLALSPDLAESPEAGAWRRLRAARPYIVGGVAASAALCGAFVAWRATRPSGLASAASVASSVISAAAESRASAKIAVAAEGPLHRGRGSAVIHGLLGVVY